MSSISNPLRASFLGRMFFIEAALKVTGGAIFILSPQTILGRLMSGPFPSSSISLTQSLGSQTIAFSIPLFLASADTPQAIGSRRIVYWSVLGRESMLAGMLLWQIWQGEQSPFEFTTTGLWWWVAELTPFIAGRLWILTQRVGWFDEQQQENKKGN